MRDNIYSVQTLLLYILFLVSSIEMKRDGVLSEVLGAITPPIVRSFAKALENVGDHTD